MESKPSIKAKRHKKRKSRTEVSSESGSDRDEQVVKQQSKQDKVYTVVSLASMTDDEVSAAFTKYYMKRAATEFSEDLDRLRSTDDFKDEALPILISALQQGTSLFTLDEQRRIVEAEVTKDKKPMANDG